VQGAIQPINGSSVKPVNAKLLAAIQRAHKTTGTAGTSVNKQSASQQSAISNTTGVETSVQSQVASSTPGSVSQQHKKNSKSQNPNQVLKHIKYNTG